MDQFQVNLFAILLAVIYNIIVGSIWYSPLLFGNRWMELLGIRKDETQGGMTPSIILGALGVALIEAFGLSLLQNFTGMDGFFGSLFTGLFAWAAFLVPPSFNHVLYEKQPRALFMINAGNNLAAFVGMSLIIGIL